MNGMKGQPTPARVSIIIPSWTGEIATLMHSVEQQTFQDYTVDVVQGVSPAARARNVGARRAQGDLLLFIDDDAYFGHPDVLQDLVNLLDADPQTAVVGTSKLTPPTATRLQKEIAVQVPRTVYPVVPATVESNPPLNAYGFTAITTTCCAVRRAVFEEVGGFDEDLTTGPEDTDFFYRIHRKGYRILLAGNSWVYHDPPATLRDLLRKSFGYGLGHALEARKSPERGMNVLALDRWYGKLAALAAVAGFPVALFIHYYFDPVRKWVLGFRPLKTLSTYAVFAGYVYGWYHGKPRTPVTTYMGRKAAGTADPRPANVFFVDAYPGIGGGQRVLTGVTARLNPARYRPVVGLQPGHPLHGPLAEAGVRTVGIRFRSSNYTLPSLRHPPTILEAGLNVLRVIHDIVRLSREEQIDLLHANSVIAGIHAVPAAWWLGKPCVVHAHDFNTAAFTNFCVKQLLHYRRTAMIFVARVLAVHYGADRPTHYRHQVIYNGVDPAFYRPDPAARLRLLRRYDLPENCVLVGAAGRLEPWKGFDILLSAFARAAADHPNARLIVVGGAQNGGTGVQDTLLELVQQLGIADKVVFTGFCAEMAPMLAGFDFLVHTPVEREGFPMTLLEAMSCGCAVVTVPAGGTVEQIIEGKNGLLAPIGDVPAIAAAMARLMGDPALARRLGAAGRRLVEERFTLDQQVTALERVYDRLLGTARQTAPAPTRQPAAEVPVAVGD